MSRIHVFVLNLVHGVRSERGASMVEYALLLALLAMAAVAALTAFGGGLGQEFSDINSTIDVNIN